MQKEEIVIRPERVEPLVIGNTSFRSVYDFQLSENDFQQALLELGETESLKNASIQELKTKLSGAKDELYRTDNHYLLRYLRYQKFKCGKAYSMIRKLYKMRTEHPEIFSLPSNLEALLKSNFVRCLPFRDEEGSMIFWVDFRKWKIEEMSVLDTLKLVNVAGDLHTLNPSCQVNGIVEILDMRDFTASHYIKIFHPSTLKVELKFFQDIYPWRIKRLMVIYCNRFVRTTFNTLRYLLKKKIADTITLLGSDMSELHQYVNPAILPKEYGGNIEESDCSMKEFALENIPYMKYERSFRLI